MKAENIKNRCNIYIYIYILVILLCLFGIGGFKSFAYSSDIFYYPNGGSWSWGSGRYASYYSYSEDDSNNDDNPSWLPYETPKRDGYTFLGYSADSFITEISSTENFANALYNYRRGIPIKPYSERAWYQDFWGGWYYYDVTVDANGKVTGRGNKYGGSYNSNVGDVLMHMRYPGQMCNQTAYAIWEKKPGFTIIFNVNGGSISISNQVAYDITLPNPGTRAGYTFDGWYNGSTRIGGIGDKWKPTADATITAKWTPIIYTIRYNTYEGNLSKEKTVTYTVESPTITLENPTLDGKEFLGWSDWNDGTPKKPYTIPKGTIGDLIISANWGVPKNNGSGSGAGGAGSGSDTNTDNSNTSHIFTGQSYVKSNRFKISA